jgi:hypothetical protein
VAAKVKKKYSSENLNFFSCKANSFQPKLFME